MNIMNRHVIAIAWLLLTGDMSFAQEATFLKCRIMEEKGLNAIPYANIVVSGTNLGTASDENGFFSLRIPVKNLTIRVSSIGYLTQSFSVDSLLKVKDPVLSLTSDVKFLDQVEIKAERSDPKEIIGAALDAIQINYSRDPFNIELYSVITNFDSIQRSHYKLESIILGYYDGYLPKAIKKFKIVEKRETGINPLASTGYAYWPSHELYSVDLITDQFSKGVFNRDNWDKFEFKQERISIYDSDTVFVISYRVPKPTTKITGYGITPKFYQGKIYIASGNYAIVRHSLETTSFTFDILYKKVGAFYFPYLIRGTRDNVFKLHGKKRDFRNFNVVTVHNIRFQNVERIDPKANEWDTDKVGFNEAYWKAYFPLN